MHKFPNTLNKTTSQRDLKMGKSPSIPFNQGYL